MDFCFDQFDFETKDFTSVDYDTLNSLYAGDAVISAAYERWSEMGFLDGLNDEDSERLAVAYDNLTYDFLTDNEDLQEIVDKLEDKVLAEVVLYVIARIVINEVDNFNYKKLIEYMKTAATIEFDDDEVEDLYGDSEAEYCALMADFVIRKFKKEEE